MVPPVTPSRRVRVIPARSKAALIFSVQDLFERAALSRRKVYFWTFTWPVPMCDWQYAKSWTRFQSNLWRRIVSHDFEAIRIWERHPGGHGLHIHMLCNERLSVQALRRLAQWAGMGKVMHVRRACIEDVDYVAKYVSKDSKIPSVKQWAKIGNWEHCRAKDLTFSSKEADLYRGAYEVMRSQGHAHQAAFVGATIYLRSRDMLSRDNTFTNDTRAMRIGHEQLEEMRG